jgi:hypothetical protein
MLAGGSTARNHLQNDPKLRSALLSSYLPSFARRAWIRTLHPLPVYLPQVDPAFATVNSIFFSYLPYTLQRNLIIPHTDDAMLMRCADDKMLTILRTFLISRGRFFGIDHYVELCAAFGATSLLFKHVQTLDLYEHDPYMFSCLNHNVNAWLNFLSIRYGESNTPAVSLHRDVFEFNLNEFLTRVGSLHNVLIYVDPLYAAPVGASWGNDSFVLWLKRLISNLPWNVSLVTRSPANMPPLNVQNVNKVSHRTFINQQKFILYFKT